MRVRFYLHGRHGFVLCDSQGSISLRMLGDVRQRSTTTGGISIWPGTFTARRGRAYLVLWRPVSASVRLMCMCRVAARTFEDESCVGGYMWGLRWRGYGCPEHHFSSLSETWVPCFDVCSGMMNRVSTRLVSLSEFLFFILIVMGHGRSQIIIHNQGFAVAFFEFPSEALRSRVPSEITARRGVSQVVTALMRTHGRCWMKGLQQGQKAPLRFVEHQTLLSWLQSFPEGIALGSCPVSENQLLQPPTKKARRLPGVAVEDAESEKSVGVQVQGSTPCAAAGDQEAAARERRRVGMLEALRQWQETCNPDTFELLFRSNKES